MSDPKDMDPQEEQQNVELMVDAPAGADAFAEAESDEGHHAFVGVEKESINVGLVSGIIVVTIVIVTALIIIAFTLTDVTSTETIATVIAETDYPELREVEAAAANQLMQYGIVDQDAQVFQIPIDRAIDLMVNEEFEQRGEQAYSDELVLIPPSR